MTISIIIAICVLLLVAYIFDISASKTKIPSVILLLIVGWAARQATDTFQIPMPDLIPTLPILGTLGLILIVLEGSLELELNKSKLGFIGKTALTALLPMFLFSGVLAFAFQYFADISFKMALANAIPFAIISSAIAIPSTHNLSFRNKEFVTYESSFSDIIGVIFFNFVTVNGIFGVKHVSVFFLELLVMIIVAIAATVGLAFLLSNIKHHVKFLPIILIIVLIFAISELYHLPALIFILIFGLFIGNIDELEDNKYIQRLRPQILDKEVLKFKELTMEVAFMVRALFFLLFGYLIETSELLNSQSILWAVGICIGIFAIRYVFLKLLRINIMPLLFIAPRGLITILLYLIIPQGLKSDIADKSLIIQVIILSSLIMMFGLMMHKTNKEKQIQDGSTLPMVH